MLRFELIQWIGVFKMGYLCVYEVNDLRNISIRKHKILDKRNDGTQYSNTHEIFTIFNSHDFDMGNVGLYITT